MATITVTNVSSEDVYIRELYVNLSPGESKQTSRSPADLTGMAGLMEAIAANKVSLGISYTSDEVASGLILTPESVEAADVAPVAPAAVASALVVIRKAFTAGGGGADDVPIYAAGALPFKFRVLDAIAYISTAAGGSSLDINTQPAGAGTNLANVSTAVTGRNPNTLAATDVADPGATEGLFIRRSDNTIVGEVILTCRIES